jgi:hypothetical protein
LDIKQGPVRPQTEQVAMFGGVQVGQSGPSGTRVLT